jgi:hypothetical protein
MSQPASVPKRIQVGIIFKQCFYNPHVKAVVAQKRRSGRKKNGY